MALKQVIVTGGRDYEDWNMFQDVLDFIDPDTIIQGGASGADRMAKEWANDRNKECVTFEADWAQHGKSAGPIRNREMIEAYPEATLVAFPGGKGTQDCITAAVHRNLIVLQVRR